MDYATRKAKYQLKCERQKERKALKRFNERLWKLVLSDGKTFYKSLEWRKIRYDVLARSRGRCALCKRDDLPLHVDHIKPRSKFPELALDPENLQVLCEDCNLGKLNRDDEDFRSDSEGLTAFDRAGLSWSKDHLQ